MKKHDFNEDVIIILSKIKEDRDYTKTKIKNLLNSIIISKISNKNKELIFEFLKMKKFKANSPNRLLRVAFTLRASLQLYEPPNLKKLKRTDVETINCSNC